MNKIKKQKQQKIKKTKKQKNKKTKKIFWMSISVGIPESCLKSELYQTNNEKIFCKNNKLWNYICLWIIFIGYFICKLISLITNVN